jgi:hypothetical protein
MSWSREDAAKAQLPERAQDNVQHPEVSTIELPLVLNTGRPDAGEAEYLFRASRSAL